MAVARGSSDILQLLANPTNRAILSVLAAQPQYPRRLADVVGLTEDEASRRLRQFEKLGLAEAEWANLGKTVRLYRLASQSITVTVTGSGLTITGLAEKEPLDVGAVGETVPVLRAFVGRERERAEVVALLRQRGAVCVHGIGGAGKTSLAAAIASAHGAPVAWHTVAPQETGMLLLSRLVGAVRALLAPAEAQRLLALRAGDEATLLVGAIADALNARGALLALDRFDGAGEGAAYVVAGIARRLQGGQLLVTGRVYPRELPRDGVAAYKLEGLDARDASDLLATLSQEAPSPEVAQRLHESTNGHPLSLVLLALASGTPDPSRLREESGIRDFLMGDVLPQLPEQERETLLMLSLLRGPFLADEAEAVCDRRHTRDALLRLEARGLVSRAGQSFALHDLVRTFAAEAAPETRKVHARAAKMLLASQEPAKVLEAIHHFQEAGDANAAAAIVHEELVRRTYRFLDQGLAPQYREQLLRLEPARGLRPTDHAAVLVELALIDASHVAVDEASRRLAEAERVLARSKGDLATPIALARGRILHTRGQSLQAADLYAEAARAAQARGDTALLLRCLVDEAFCREEHDDAEALALYERAIEIGQEVSDLMLRSVAQAGASRIAARMQREDATPRAEEALRLARLAGSLRGEAAVYMTLAGNAIMRRDPAAGLAHSRRYLEVADRLGDPWVKACALTDVAFLSLANGEAQQAKRDAEEALRIAQSISNDYYVLGASVALGESRLVLGDPRAAIDALEPALRDTRAWPALVARGWYLLARAYEDVGEPAGARHAADRAREFEGTVDFSRPDRFSHIIRTPGGLNP